MSMFRAAVATSPRYAALRPTAQQELVLTAAVGADVAAAEAFAAWTRGVDLSDHFDRATYRLLPLLSSRMRALGVRHPLLTRLDGVYRRSWYETNTLFHATAPMVAALEAQGIETMLLEGVPLALTCYQNHAVRPMSDISLIVRPAQTQPAITALATAGWNRVDATSDHDLRYRHAMLFRDAAGTDLVLHRHFMFEACNPETDAAVWGTARPLDFAGVATRQPEPSLMLLHAVLHGMRFNPEPPIWWVADALAIMHSCGGDVDWERMVAFARAQKMTHRLGLGLTYLATAWNAPVPSEILAALSACPISLTERIENTVVFRNIPRLLEHPLTKQWVIFADYCRCAPATDPIPFAVGLPDYLRYRWRLRSRREIPSQVIRGSLRRLRCVWS